MKISQQHPAYSSPWKPLFHVCLFCAITLAIHKGYYWWSDHYQFYPLHKPITNAAQWMAHRLFLHSALLVDLFMPVDIRPETQTFVLDYGRSVYITAGCSGLKQWIQVGLLLLVFPGPWRHKLWYIPLGMLLLHIVNIFRIVALCALMRQNPDQWQWIHDWLFRPFFYIVIFLLWAIWVERFQTAHNQT